MYLVISDTNFQAYIYITYKNMASWEAVNEIDFEDEYDKVDLIDDYNLDESINTLNEAIREQEELEDRVCRTEWSSMNSVVELWF